MRRHRYLPALGVLGVLGVAACGPGAHQAERLAVGDVEVQVERTDDGRYRACVVAGAAVPDPPLCVGPHDGAAGPGHSWSGADRLGSQVVFLVILGRDDSLVDARFATARSSRFPVSVAGGVIADDGSGLVCSTYESAGTLYHYDTGVTVGAAEGGASTTRIGCDA